MLSRILLRSFAWITLLLMGATLYSQDRYTDSLFVNRISTEMLQAGGGYTWLRPLCLNIGHRLSGSASLERATQYMHRLMDSLRFDTVWLQPCKVPHWVRGGPETGRVIKSNSGKFDIDVLSLGNVNGTGPDGVIAPVVMFSSLEELKNAPVGQVSGNIVFINKHFEDHHWNTFSGYGATVPVRSSGMESAQSKGALAFMCRSISPCQDDHPHTGGTRMTDSLKQIPAFAVSLNSADKLAKAVESGKTILRLYSEAKYLGLADGYNVIGELRGSTYPAEVVMAAGHLDSWDVGHGAHDDGAGCVHAIEAIHVLRRLGYQPQRTLRVVLYTNEENGLAGGLKYKEYADSVNEKTVLAIESDAGGHTPLGLSFLNEPVKSKRYARLNTLMDPVLKDLGLWYKPGFAGVDINVLSPHTTLLYGLVPDNQRYFDYHHAANDTYDKINRRELHLGTTVLATLIYFADKYGCE